VTKIFGPIYENGSWRIKTNQELDKLVKHKNVINFARAQSLGWYGHVERMQETKNSQSNTRLVNHCKEANGKTKDTLGGKMMLKKIYIG
jgi:hypothetical protein